jgi:hypothetical protein
MRKLNCKGSGRRKGGSRKKGKHTRKKEANEAKGETKEGCRRTQWENG